MVYETVTREQCLKQLEYHVRYRSINDAERAYWNGNLDSLVYGVLCEMWDDHRLYVKYCYNATDFLVKVAREIYLQALEHNYR